MNAVSNKEQMRRFYEDLWSAGNLAVAEELIATDLIDHMPMPGMPPGRDGMIAIVTAIRAGLPDMKIEINGLVEEGDRVAGRWTTTATHTGELFGIPATGRSVTFSGSDIIRWQDGKAAEIWHIEDMMTLMQQIGVIPAPGQ